MVVDALIEGPTDEAVARRLISACGHEFGTPYGKRGFGFLRQKVRGFNARARYGNPILMLVDFMDTELECPPEVPISWLPERAEGMLLRVVVPELESWLLADYRCMAKFLGISRDSIPREPEMLTDPKRELINLARRSRSRHIREAMVPATGLSASVGPGYVAAIDAYVAGYWNADAATERSPSLQRCLRRLREL